MIRVVHDPNKVLRDWAIGIVVNNMKVYNKTPLLRHAKTKSINNKENIFIFSFDNDNNPNGFVSLRQFSTILYIYEIHVDRNYQSKGIGSGLLAFVKEYSKGNVEQIVLYVYKTNTRAIEFYERNGFTKNKQSKCDFKYFEMIFQLDKVLKKEIVKEKNKQTLNGRKEKDKKDNGKD